MASGWRPTRIRTSSRATTSRCGPGMPSASSRASTWKASTARGSRTSSCAAPDGPDVLNEAPRDCHRRRLTSNLSSRRPGLAGRLGYHRQRSYPSDRPTTPRIHAHHPAATHSRRPRTPVFRRSTATPMSRRHHGRPHHGRYRHEGPRPEAGPARPAGPTPDLAPTGSPPAGSPPPTHSEPAAMVEPAMSAPVTTAPPNGAQQMHAADGSNATAAPPGRRGARRLPERQRPRRSQRARDRHERERPGGENGARPIGRLHGPAAARFIKSRPYVPMQSCSPVASMATMTMSRRSTSRDRRSTSGSRRERGRSSASCCAAARSATSSRSTRWRRSSSACIRCARCRGPRPVPRGRAGRSRPPRNRVLDALRPRSPSSRRARTLLAPTAWRRRTDRRQRSPRRGT